MSFTISPIYGYQISSVLYNGTEVKTQLTNLIDGVNYYNGGTYAAPALSQASTLVVSFASYPTTSVNTQGKALIQVLSGNKQIELQGLTPGDEVNIYTLTGSKLIAEKAGTSTISMSLAQGIYIVKVANQIHKVVIR